MILFKDPKTNKKSLTITFLLISFILCCFCILGNVYALIIRGSSDSSLIWGSIGFCSLFVALYFKKRFKVSASGIELDQESKNGNIDDNIN